MNYNIRRCKECNKEVHLHPKKGTTGYTLKNTCEHIPNKKNNFFSKNEAEKYLTRAGEIASKKRRNHRER
jgi:hypothetical protein